MNRRPWNDADRDAFRRGDVLRASTIAGKRRPAPTADEWDDDEEDA